MKQGLGIRTQQIQWVARRKDKGKGWLLAAIVDNEKVAFLVELLQKGTSHASQSDLWGRGWDEPYLRVEAIQPIENIV